MRIIDYNQNSRRYMLVLSVSTRDVIIISNKNYTARDYSETNNLPEKTK